MGREFVCLEILDSSTSTCPPRLPDDSLNPFALFEPRQVATMGGVSVRDVDVSVPLHLIDRCSLWWMSSFLEAWAGGHMDIVMRWNGISAAAMLELWLWLWFGWAAGEEGCH